ncbi:sulfur carrier protein ThiS [Gelidibacter salicanalis]|uniref:Sulfur carrier protein ThiS n=1 Tax=Gelidibacter salicanalis TaxID=291193 RepID=A0A934KX74_9FLAO|nr:sulfur carrier protein ThiS [Gelidibacter salicanalis]MBJ7881978.1 sulfur carrier protein ThiS [Gelidibacter salicanalis]
MIKLRVNEKSIEVNNDFNILQLLNQINSPQDGIAVAVNNTIVVKNSWESKTLLENDTVLIIQATQGG